MHSGGRRCELASCYDPPPAVQQPVRSQNLEAAIEYRLRECDSRRSGCLVGDVIAPRFTPLVGWHREGVEREASVARTKLAGFLIAEVLRPDLVIGAVLPHRQQRLVDHLAQRVVLGERQAVVLLLKD